MNLQTINNIIVNPVKVKKINPKKIKGYDLFPELYCNILTVARKKSGKTSTIFEILKSCSDKETKVFIFSSTGLRDLTYIEIEKWLKDQKMGYKIFTSMIENGVNIVKNIIDELKKNFPEEEEVKVKEEEAKPFLLSFTEEEDEITIKIKKPNKIVAPKYFFIFDDLSTELKNSALSELLKSGHRHIHAKTIVSTQYPNDLYPGDKLQFDYWIIFKGHVEEKLEEIYKSADLSVTFKKFLELYYSATEQDYSFLYIDRVKNEFRKNFNQLYNLS